MSVQDVRGRLTSPAHVGVTLAAICGVASIAAGATTGALHLTALVAMLVAAGAVGIVAGFSTSGSV
jgi:hypothetical protein